MTYALKEMKCKHCIKEIILYNAYRFGSATHLLTVESHFVVSFNNSGFYLKEANEIN